MVFKGTREENQSSLSFRKAVIAYHLYCLHTAIENRCSLSLSYLHREKWTSVNLITRFSNWKLIKLRDTVSLMMYPFIALLLGLPACSGRKNVTLNNKDQIRILDKIENFTEKHERWTKLVNYSNSYFTRKFWTQQHTRAFFCAFGSLVFKYSYVTI